MTALDRFDPFDQRVADALEQIAPAHRPDYLDDVFQQTARTSQRPRWTFPERWLPMDAAFPRTGPARAPVRPLVLLALVALLIVALAVVAVGSRKRVPPPFGLAGNGQIAYAEGGDIFVRDGIDGEARLLISTGNNDGWPYYSPDGTRLVFTAVDADDKAYDYFANADGTGVVKAILDPIVGDGHWAWAPDSRRLAIVNETGIRGILNIATVDGQPPAVLDIPDLSVSTPSWQPPNGDRILFRGTSTSGVDQNTVDLYTIQPDGTDLRALGLPSPLVFGAQWENTGPTWSPDAARIAYNQVEPLPGGDPAGHFRVHLVKPDGTGDVAVPGPTDDRVQEAWPAYSPDGTWILVHRWTWTNEPDGGYGWLAVMPASGTMPARDIGPRIPGGENSGLIKVWSPDGTRVLARAESTGQVFSIDPATGDYEELPWTTELPDWQRVAP